MDPRTTADDPINKHIIEAALNRLLSKTVISSTKELTFSTTFRPLNIKNKTESNLNSTTDVCQTCEVRVNEQHPKATQVSSNISELQKKKKQSQLSVVSIVENEFDLLFLLDHCVQLVVFVDLN